MTSFRKRLEYEKFEGLCTGGLTYLTDCKTGDVSRPVPWDGRRQAGVFLLKHRSHGMLSVLLFIAKDVSDQNKVESSDDIICLEDATRINYSAPSQ